MLFFFLETVSLTFQLWPGIYQVDQVGLELTGVMECPPPLYAFSVFFKSTKVNIHWFGSQKQTNKNSQPVNNFTNGFFFPRRK